MILKLQQRKKMEQFVCKKYGASDSIEYNVYTDTISYYNRRKKTLFDGFVERQIETNVYNKFHELLKDNKHSDYDALKTIGNCFEQVSKIMNNQKGLKK